MDRIIVFAAKAEAALVLFVRLNTARKLVGLDRTHKFKYESRM